MNEQQSATIAFSLPAQAIIDARKSAWPYELFGQLLNEAMAPWLHLRNEPVGTAMPRIASSLVDVKRSTDDLKEQLNCVATPIDEFAATLVAAQVYFGVGGAIPNPVAIAETAQSAALAYRHLIYNYQRTCVRPWRVDKDTMPAVLQLPLAQAFHAVNTELERASIGAVDFLERIGNEILLTIGQWRESGENGTLNLMLNHRVEIDDAALAEVLDAATAAIERYGDDAQCHLQRGEQEIASSTAGTLYLLMNPAMPGLVKIGKTRRGAADRARELTAASGVPSPFVVVYEISCADCDVAERAAHAGLDSMRVARNREFFRVDSTTAINVMRAIQDRELAYLTVSDAE